MNTATGETLTLDAMLDPGQGGRSLDCTQDAEIWNAFRNGNEMAFTYIYQSYFNELFRNSLRFSPDKNLIKDCIQDFFIAIHRNRKNLGTTTSIRSYLSLSVKRKLARYLKKESKYQAIDNWHVEDLVEQDMPFEFTMIEEQKARDEIKKLKTAFDQLPERQRKALYHFYFENCSYAQVAEQMGMTNIKSARNLVYKGINSLKGYLN